MENSVLLAGKKSNISFKVELLEQQLQVRYFCASSTTECLGECWGIPVSCPSSMDLLSATSECDICLELGCQDLIERSLSFSLFIL